VDERARRIGLNEALFRRVNEQIEDINAGFGVLAGSMTMVCECGDQSCIDHIEITFADYERVRSDSRLFAILPGHEIADVERVVERREGFWTVEKDPGAPARLAEEEDRRR
jgi:hypothetical protein